MPNYLTENLAGIDGAKSSVHLRGFIPLKHVRGYGNERIWPSRLFTDYTVSGSDGIYTALQDEVARRAGASRALVRQTNKSAHIVVPNAGIAFHNIEFGGVTAELFMAKLQYARAEDGSFGEEVLVFPTQRRVLFLFEYKQISPYYAEIDSHPLRRRVGDVTREMRFNLTVASRRFSDSPVSREGIAAA